MIGPDKEYSVEEWKAEAIKRFGKDPLTWKFVCPNCGHVQCGQDFMNINMRSPAAIDPTRSTPYPVKDCKNTAYQECIGRYGVGTGCDYCAFGLIDSDTKVVTPDGKKIPIFPFAEAES